MSELGSSTGCCARLLLALSLLAGTAAPRAAEPQSLSVGQPMSPEDQGQPRVAEGVVTFVGRQGTSLNLELSSEAGHMQVTVSEAEAGLDELLFRSHLQVQGICRGIHSSDDGSLRGALTAPSLKEVTLLQVPEETWQRYPLWSLATLNAALRTNPPAALLRLRGKLSDTPTGETARLTDKEAELQLRFAQAPALAAGTDLEVLALLDRAGSNRLCQAIVTRTVPKARARPTALPLLTSTEQVRWLTPEEARRGYPVRVRAVVTCLLGPPQEPVGNLADGTGGIFAWHLVPAGNTPLKVGDYCEVEGRTSPGDFSPGIQCRKLTVLGTAAFPQPLRPTWNELTSGSLDTQWVELEGIGLAVTEEHLEIGVPGGRISCYVPRGGRSLERLLDAVVHVRGVVVADWDQGRHVQGVHLNVPGEEFISLRTPAPADPFALPAKPIRDLLFYEPGASAFRREKVLGQIVGAREGLYYLMSDTKGLRLLCKEESRLTPGEVVEAVGFPELDYSTEPPLVILRQALVRRRGHQPLPTPTPIPPGDLPGSEHDSTLVRLDGRLVRWSVYGSDQVLELQTGARSFFARLQTAARVTPRPPGTRLAITGVYAFNQAGTRGRTATGACELWLNAPGDIQVLALPSWWTTEHALMVVGALTLLLLLGLVWIGLLRQQVQRRTAQLSTANRSLANEVQERKRAENALVQARLQHVVEQERTRIARDIHDELGCSLSQIRLLSELALTPTEPAGDVQAHAGKISAKALEATHVLDEIVWAVDPQNDTLESLLNYLFTFASDYLALAGIRFRIDAPTQIPHHGLTAPVRHQLYMAFKEVLTNIVKHAQATEVWVRLHLEPARACFIVEDNGRGFELSGKGAPGASGLENLRRRLADIGGDCTLESSPERGTCVQLVLPLGVAAQA